MVHKHIDITLEVASVRRENAAHLSLDFVRPPGFDYEPGDWMDIEFAGEELRGGTTYSFSSSPTEPQLSITFREGISPLKRRLASAQPGDKLRITQYGNDFDFYLKDNRPSVLIAGGVGVAPFRSMLKDMADRGVRNDVSLVYLNQADDFLYDDEIAAWQAVGNGLQVERITTKGLKRKEREKLLSGLINSQARYYVAGPTGMVETTVKLLKERGIDAKDIRTDSFEGY